MLEELYWGVERVMEMRVEGMDTMVLFLKLIVELLKHKRKRGEKCEVTRRWLAEKVSWQMEGGNLYSYFSPSITAGLSDPAHF